MLLAGFLRKKLALRLCDGRCLVLRWLLWSFETLPRLAVTNAERQHPGTQMIHWRGLGFSALGKEFKWDSKQ